MNHESRINTKIYCMISNVSHQCEHNSSRKKIHKEFDFISIILSIKFFSWQQQIRIKIFRKALKIDNCTWNRTRFIQSLETLYGSWVWWTTQKAIFFLAMWPTRLPSFSELEKTFLKKSMFCMFIKKIVGILPWIKFLRQLQIVQAQPIWWAPFNLMLMKFLNEQF